MLSVELMNLMGRQSVSDLVYLNTLYFILKDSNCNDKNVLAFLDYVHHIITNENPINWELLIDLANKGSDIFSINMIEIFEDGIDDPHYIDCKIIRDALNEGNVFGWFCNDRYINRIDNEYIELYQAVIHALSDEEARSIGVGIIYDVGKAVGAKLPVNMVRPFDKMLSNLNTYVLMSAESNDDSLGTIMIYKKLYKYLQENRTKGTDPLGSLNALINK